MNKDAIKNNPGVGNYNIDSSSFNSKFGLKIGIKRESPINLTPGP